MTTKKWEKKLYIKYNQLRWKEEKKSWCNKNFRFSLPQKLNQLFFFSFWTFNIKSRNVLNQLIYTIWCPTRKTCDVKSWRSSKTYTVFVRFCMCVICFTLLNTIYVDHLLCWQYAAIFNDFHQKWKKKNLHIRSTHLPKTTDRCASRKYLNFMQIE